MITIVARGSVRPERVEELRARALDLVGSSRDEPGNVSYDFYEDLDDPTRFTFIEIWQDRDAIDLHNAAPHFGEFVERAAPLFAGPLEIALCRKLS